MRRGCFFAAIVVVILIVRTCVFPVYADEGKETTGYSVEAESIVQRMKDQINSRDNNNLLQGAMPCLGNAHVLVINVVLDNVDNYLTTDEIDDLLFGDTYSNGSSIRNENLTDYYESVSYGKMHLTGEVVEYNCSTFAENDLELLSSILDDVLSSREDEQFDQNQDGYLDGVYFLVPTTSTSRDGSCNFWNYEREGHNSSAYCIIAKRRISREKSISTVAHETVHLMGLPDIYGNVGVNLSGTHTDTILEGLSSNWNGDRGTVHSNIAGIMKFFFGWIDNVVEVSSNGTYNLRSYSKYPEAMVLYPEGNRESNFIFFIELMTEDNNDRIIDKVSDENGGGLRIWRVLLNVDGEGNIIGNSQASGMGNSPFSYLDALSSDSSSYYLHSGGQLNALTEPNLDYFLNTEIGEYYDSSRKYTYYPASLPKEYLDSKLSVNNVSIEDRNAVIDISYEERDTFFVSFDKNGGSGNMGKQEVASGQGFILPDCTFSAPDGKRFKEWNIQGITYDPGDSVEISKSITVQAIWERIPRDAFEINYVWERIEVENASGYVVTGTATLKSDPKYVEKEYSNAWSEYINPGCEEYGEEKWIAEFQNDLFETQYKSEKIDPIGHDWGEWTIIKEATETEEGIMQRICNNDHSHIETKSIPVINQSETLPDKENVLTLPVNLTIIEEESLSGISAEMVILPSGCKEIKNRAFADCGTLVGIFIPESVTVIASDAFEGTSLVIYTPAGSYAQQFAEHAGIQFINIESAAK